MSKKEIEVLKNCPLSFTEHMAPDVVLQPYQKEIIKAFGLPKHMLETSTACADKDCIELYPAASDVVNVANMRHLFVLDEPHPLNWKNNGNN